MVGWCGWWEGEPVIVCGWSPSPCLPPSPRRASHPVATAGALAAVVVAAGEAGEVATVDMVVCEVEVCGWLPEWFAAHGAYVAGLVPHKAPGAFALVLAAVPSGSRRALTSPTLEIPLAGHGYG